MAVVDHRVVEERLRKLEEYLNLLAEHQKQSEAGFVQDKTLQAAVERFLQLAIECILDIGNHIIASEGFEKPEAYKEIPTVLAGKEIIPEKFSQMLAEMAKFRNLLVHDYMKIDAHKVYRILQDHLQDFRQFATYIETYLSSPH